MLRIMCPQSVPGPEHSAFRFPPDPRERDMFGAPGGLLALDPDGSPPDLLLHDRAPEPLHTRTLKGRPRLTTLVAAAVARSWR
jgi:hypothetical protein